MKSQCLFGTALAAALAFGAPLMAQTTTLPPIVTVPQPVFQQSFTTGMVGFTLNQTARLNVLNLNLNAIPNAYTTVPANCTVQLQFFDGSNNSLGQFVVPNFAAGTATAFDLKREAVKSATASRVEIRGVVTVNPAPTVVESPAAIGYCSVVTTLEIFDDTTGSTVALTSDTRATGLGYVVPAVVAAPR